MTRGVKLLLLLLKSICLIYYIYWFTIFTALVDTNVWKIFVLQSWYVVKHILYMLRLYTSQRRTVYLLLRLFCVSLWDTGGWVYTSELMSHCKDILRRLITCSTLFIDSVVTFGDFVVDLLIFDWWMSSSWSGRGSVAYLRYRGRVTASWKFG